MFGQITNRGEIKLGEIINRWFEDVAVHRLRPSTINTHRINIRNHIQPSLGHVRLKDIRPAHLQILDSEKLKSGLSKRTVKYIHAIMHQSLYQALKWGLVAGNVADAAESPYPLRRLVEHLTREQIANSMDT